MNRSQPSIPDFTKALYRRFPRRFIGVLVLLVILGLTEGVGLVLLVPLLALVGLPVVGGAPAALQEAITGVFGALGWSLELGPVLLLFLGIIGIRALLQWWTTYQAATLEQRFALHHQERLYRAVLGAGWLTLVRLRIPDLTHALTVEVARVAHAAAFLTRGLTLIAVNAVVVVFALVVAPWITLLAGLIGLVLLTLGRRWNLRFQTSGEDLTRVGRQVSAAVQDHLGTLKTAKSYGAEARSVANFVRYAEDRVAATLEVDRTLASASGWISFFATAVLCGLVYGAVKVWAIPVATLLLLVLVFSRVVPRVLSLQANYHRLLNSLPGYGNVLELTERCEAGSEGVWGPGSLGDGAGLNLEREIGFVGVSFRYNGVSAETSSETQDAPTLTDVTLSIPAYQTTAIVGPSGAGKTTVADLVLGLLRPDQGQVLVDDEPLTKERLAGWRRQIGYVPQDGTLLPDTIRANLLWANPQADEGAMWEALGLAAAEEFVRGLPQGLETGVGERGALLSGGERQRLVLACALVRGPSLLVLDEATSALDASNESQILEALRGLHGRVTTLVISHRASAVRDADRTYVLERGRIVESAP